MMTPLIHEKITEILNPILFGQRLMLQCLHSGAAHVGPVQPTPAFLSRCPKSWPPGLTPWQGKSQSGSQASGTMNKNTLNRAGLLKKGSRVTGGLTRPLLQAGLPPSPLEPSKDHNKICRELSGRKKAPHSTEPSCPRPCGLPSSWGLSDTYTGRGP